MLRYAILLAVVTLAAARDVTPSDAPTRAIAFASKRDGNWEIHLVSADGTQRTRLTTRADQDRFPLWSPDGTKLAFGAQRATWELWVMNADGSGQQQIAANVADQPDTEWSPDGSRIAYVGMANGNADIFSVAPDGSDQSRVQLTVDSGADTAPAWSPDGALIAFLSTRDGIMAGDGQGPVKELWLMNADGSSQTAITSEPVEHWYPDWFPGS